MPFFNQPKTVIKLHNWWDSKVPPLLTFAYMLLLQREMDFITASLNLLLLIIWIIGAAGFGHYLNDCFDIQQDVAAGKPNSAAQHSTVKRIVILLGLTAILFFPWTVNRAGAITLSLILLHLVLFFLYSAPPFRLKEKGFLGIIADALYAHTVPTFIVIFALLKNEHDSFSSEQIVIATSCFIWTVSWGVRNIIAHQISDYELDLKSGTTTFVTKYGKQRSFFLMMTVLVPLEILPFMVLAKLMLPVVIPVFIVFLIYKFLLYKFAWKLKPSADLPGSLNSFLSNFYEQWFPIVPLVLLSIQNPVFLVLLFIHLFLFTQFILNLRNQLKSILGLLK